MISGYRSMRLFVMFDLPVGTRAEMKDANKFRKFLLAEGYNMKQLSIYMKYFMSRNSANASLERISRQIPPYGNVTGLFVTDKQFGLMRNFYGQNRQKKDKKPEQLLLL